MRTAALADMIALAKAQDGPFSRAVAASTQEDKFVVHAMLEANLREAGYEIAYEQRKVLQRAEVTTTGENRKRIIVAQGMSDTIEDSLRQALYAEIKEGR